MIIIVGLGNPGKEFEKTPHNIGFRVVDNYAKEHEFPDFELDKKANAEVSKKGKIILAKPQTFMNNSGKAVKSLALLYKTKNITVIHDDKDLKIGQLRIVVNGGSAGHKGVESVAKAVGNKTLTRIKVGTTATKKPVDAMKTVIKEFKDEEEKLAKKAIKKAALALTALIEQGIDQARNEFHRD